MSRYRRYSKRHYRTYWASQHVSARLELSNTFGGIDKDVERIFLSLPNVKLESVFMRYGQQHDASALSYARAAYPRWQSGSTKMSGKVAERLLNLVPLVLDASARFDLVKKLRSAHMEKLRRHVTCEPNDWRNKVAPVLAELLTASQTFKLAPHVVERVRWLAGGDATAAQQLLAAAEQEEAAVRLGFLEAEFKRIDFLLQNIEATKVISHTIELPQGTISVSIAMPKKGFWSWLGDLLP